MVIYDQYLASSFDAIDDGVHSIIKAIKTMCNLQDRHILFKLNFMLREILNNAVEHGNSFDPHKKVHCVIEYNKPELKFSVSDEGQGIKRSETIDADYKRERQRGYPTILEMGFEIEINNTTVTLKLNI